MFRYILIDTNGRLSSLLISSWCRCEIAPQTILAQTNEGAGNWVFLNIKRWRIQLTVSCEQKGSCLGRASQRPPQVDSVTGHLGENTPAVSFLSHRDKLKLNTCVCMCMCVGKRDISTSLFFLPLWVNIYKPSQNMTKHEHFQAHFNSPRQHWEMVLQISAWCESRWGAYTELLAFFVQWAAGGEKSNLCVSHAPIKGWWSLFCSNEPTTGERLICVWWEKKSLTKKREKRPVRQQFPGFLSAVYYRWCQVNSL